MPSQLLSTFKKAIDDGHVKTWSYDTVGDFTHTPDQWKYKAWLMKSAFDNEEGYVLTELGKEFVHYTMNETVTRVAGNPSPF